MRLRTAYLVPACAATLALTACGSAAPSSAPVAATPATSSSSPTPTPTPTELGEVSSVIQLRDAAAAAGYVCPSWDQSNIVEKASESGSCSDADVLSIYTSQANRDSVVDFMKGMDDAELSLLVGPNWIINGKDAPGLQSHLGGTVVNADTAALGSASEASPSAATFDAKAADFKIAVKILKKKCFGSAGCNVTYRIDPEYVGATDLPDSGTIEITYTVKGLEDGEAVNIFTIEGGQASFDSQETGSVVSSKSKLSARATDVSYTP